MWKEAMDLCDESLEKNLGCIVSIGTGIPNLKKFGENAKEVVQSIVRIATDTEMTANTFNHIHSKLNEGQKRYFRFNTPRGLGGIDCGYDQRLSSR